LTFHCIQLAADGETSALDYLYVVCDQYITSSINNSFSCSVIQGSFRVLCLVLMLVCNGLMMTLFVKGLHETDSLTATVTSAAVNFILSATAGHVLFGEMLPIQWWLGAFVILVGMGCLLYGDSTGEKDKKE
jgi:drug/metabolite transporter (DMT)-like permease